MRKKKQACESVCEVADFSTLEKKRKDYKDYAREKHLEKIQERACERLEKIEDDLIMFGKYTDTVKAHDGFGLCVLHRLQQMYADAGYVAIVVDAIRINAHSLYAPYHYATKRLEISFKK